MQIFDDNFNTFKRLSEINNSYNSDINALFYINSITNNSSTVSDQPLSDFQAPSIYNQIINYQTDSDIDSISDNFERDARRYSRGFENGVIY